MMHLEFKSAEFPACRHGYLVNIPAKEGSAGIEGDGRLFRVSAYNWSKNTSIEQVRLVCEAISPNLVQGRLSLNSHLPVPLRAMHDRSDGMQRSQGGITIHPGERAFFDVVAKIIRPDEPVYLCTAVKDMTLVFPPQRTVLTLSLYGRNIDKETQSFVVEEEDDGDLVFYPQQAPSLAQAQ